MSVREEDRRKKSNSTSTGVGLAAAAIGVGVGAALYYFFSKGPENPGGEGSTTGWNCERDHALLPSPEHEDSYTTISENYTTDTSMHSSNDSLVEFSYSSSGSPVNEDWHTLSDVESSIEIMEDATDTSESCSEDTDEDFSYEDSVTEFSISLPVHDSVDSDMGDWDVTNSPTGVPDAGLAPATPLYRNFQNIVSPIWSGRRQIRERSWSLEECSICFDVILKDQRVTTLPCTHHFHEACLAPWLQEHQTCPNCRKAAE